MFFVDWFEEHGNIRLRNTRGEHEKQVADTLRWWRFGHANRKRGSLLYNWNLAQRTVIAGEKSVKSR